MNAIYHHCTETIQTWEINQETILKPNLDFQIDGTGQTYLRPCGAQETPAHTELFIGNNDLSIASLEIITPEARQKQREMYAKLPCTTSKTAKWQLARMLGKAFAGMHRWTNAKLSGISASKLHACSSQVHEGPPCPRPTLEQQQPQP